MAMAKIWANRLIAGTRTWDEVPEGRKKKVKKVLMDIANGASEDAEAARELLVEIDEEES